MAKKVTSKDSHAAQRPDADIRQKNSRAALRRWWLAFGLVAVICIGTGLVLFRNQRISRQVLKLPAPPELSAGQADFRQRLMEAQARATQSPGALEGVVDLGRLYHATGFRTEAEVCWRILHSAQPQEARWCYYLSDLRRMAADMEGLKSWLEQTLELAPDYAPAWLELAEMEFKTNRLDDAERAYRRRSALVPGDPYASLGLARVMLQRGQRSEGRRLIEALVSQSPDFPSAHNIYAELLAQDGDIQGAANQRWFGTVAGRFRAAADPWKEDLRAWCFDPDQLMVWGAIALQTKQEDWGRALFERAIRLAPANARGYENLGLLYVEKGETARAVEVFETGLKQQNASERLFVSLCNAYRTLRQPAEALRVARQGLAVMPDSADLFNVSGLALDDAGHPEEAMAAYRVAIARAPSAADPVANLGISLLRAGRREEAYTCLKQAVELQPMFAKALTLLARFELEAGRLKSAAQYIFPYFQQYPGLRSARDLMAKFYLRSAVDADQRNDATGSEQACRDGLAIVPEDAELHGFLGVQYLRQRRLPEALSALETSRQLQPDDPRTGLYLGQVYAELGRVDDARRLLGYAEKQATQRGDAALAAQSRQLLRKLPP